MKTRRGKGEFFGKKREKHKLSCAAVFGFRKRKYGWRRGNTRPTSGYIQKKAGTNRPERQRPNEPQEKKPIRKRSPDPCIVPTA